MRKHQEQPGPAVCSYGLFRLKHCYDGYGWDSGRPNHPSPPNKTKTSKNKTKVAQRENIRYFDATKANNWLSNLMSYSPFPNRAMRRLVWALGSTLTSSATAYNAGTEYILQLNGLFDPDLTGGTHQPYGFDQMATIYGRYVVHAVTVDIRIIRPVNQMNAYVASAQPSNATFVLTANALGNLDEQPNTHVEMLDSQGNVAHIRKRFTIAELEGVTEQQLRANLEEYGALVTANPARTPYLRLALVNLATAAQSVQTILRLEYEAEFYDRNILPASS